MPIGGWASNPSFNEHSTNAESGPEVQTRMNFGAQTLSDSLGLSCKDYPIGSPTRISRPTLLPLRWRDQHQFIG
jgi:hypothetical protein